MYAQIDLRYNLSPLPVGTQTRVSISLHRARNV